MSDAGWTNGRYVGRAIGSCFPKGRKYPNEPLELWSDRRDTEQVSESFRDADRFAGFAAAFNRRNSFE